MGNAIRLRLIGGAVILFILWFIGHYNIQGPIVLLISFGFAAAYELFVVRPQTKKDDAQKKKDRIASCPDNTQQDIKCKNCGFIAFGISEKQTEAIVCNNCGKIIGAEDPMPEDNARLENMPSQGGPNAAEKIIPMSGGGGEMEFDARKKKIAGWTLILVVGMLLFPPWIYTEKGEGKGRQSARDDAGYSFVINPPNKAYSGIYGVKNSSPAIDWGRLAIQLAIVACVAGGAAFTDLRTSKKTLKICGSLAGGAVGLFSLLAAYDYYTNTLPRKQVSIGVSYDTEGCSEKYPMMVLITNKGSKTVEKVGFNISIKIPGRSTNLVQNGFSQKYSSDEIIPPGGTGGACWSYPDDLSRIASVIGKDLKLEKLDYAIEDKYVTLQ